MDEPQGPDQQAYEDAQRAASRARLMLNALVVLSAAASSVFLVYVLTRILPRGNGDGANVEVPTSAAQEKVGLLRGQSAKPELSVEFRDVDEAPGYREKYSDKLREALGVNTPGRIYQFSVRNLSKTESFEFKGGKLSLTGKGGEYAVAWLPGIARPVSPLGRMTLAQSESSFTLAPGERRDVFVFVAGDAPAAADLAGGTVEIAGGTKLSLERVLVTIGRRAE